MNTCQWIIVGSSETCGKICEGKNTLCATHARISRKLVDEAQKAVEKRAMVLSKPQAPRQKPNLISEKRKSESEIYSEKREQFLLTRWCAYHGHGCIPTTVHHSKGRVGSLYLDERYWKALCMVAHEWVEKNPDKAKDLGLSQSRLATTEILESNE